MVNNIIGVTALALCLSAVSGSAVSGASAHDLTIAVQKIPDSIDPVTENSNVNLRIVYSLYETLVKTDYRHGGILVPGLATSWKVMDPKTIEFHLRKGVTFHNGDTLDAQDVVATFAPVRRGMDKNVPVASRQFLAGIDHVEVVDSMTVRLHMKDDDAIALARFAGFPSQIISAAAFNSAKTYQQFATQGVGTGPYALKEFEHGDTVILEKFPGYWGNNKAAADEVTFRQVPELSTRIAGLLSGQFDLITEVGPDQISQIESHTNSAVVGGPIENIRALFYDSTNPVLEDPRIRQALNLAIDRQALVDSFFGGRTSVPHGWQMKTFGAMYLKDRPLPKYDPKKARALLKDAGYKGEPIIYRTRNYYTKQIDIAQILQSMWKQVGLNVNVEIKENRAQVFEDNDRRMIVDASFSAYYPDPMGQFWRRFGPNSSYSGTYWKQDPTLIRMGQDLATSINTSHRREVFGAMLDRFAKSPNGAILYTMAQFMGERSDRISLTVLPTEYLDLTVDGLSFKN